MGGIGGIAQDTVGAAPRRQFSQQFNPFAYQGDRKIGHARDIAARAGERFGEPRDYRIADQCHDDGNRGSGFRHLANQGIGISQDNVGAEAHHFRGERCVLLGAPVGGAVFKMESLAGNPPCLAHSLFKCGKTGAATDGAGGLWFDKSDRGRARLRERRNRCNERARSKCNANPAAADHGLASGRAVGQTAFMAMSLLECPWVDEDDIGAFEVACIARCHCAPMTFGNGGYRTVRKTDRIAV